MTVICRLASSNDCRKMKRQKSGKVVHPNLKVFQHRHVEVSGDENASEEVLIFRFRFGPGPGPGRGAHMPLLDRLLKPSSRTAYNLIPSNPS